ncbi:MAG: bacillithiol biosynthesis cysteine-adding enzyme BshC [Candidatus Eremiobacteraeota bacterium]|nr:bacillithiol biosynthesis cysteine-adding enzyme BshC [Candidatus Eremiobacteraeota bacterium]
MKINFKDMPGATKLYLDYLYDFEKVQEFYKFSSFEEIEYTIQFDILKKRKYQRNEIADILVEQNKKYGAHSNTLKMIEKMRDPNTFVVFTGQQVGMFGGPLYTIYKALTAVNLSIHLTMHTPYSVVPCFWIEGEDHDFEEIRSTYVIDKNNRLLELKYDPLEPFSGQPVGGMVIDESINGLFEKFAQNTHDTDFKDEIMESLRECYKPGTTLADSFGRWMTHLIGKYGMIMVDASDPRFKEMALPVYQKSLDLHGDKINSELTRVSDKLVDLGYHKQVSHRMDSLDFFYHNPRRLPFIKENNGYHLKESDLYFTKDELRDFIDKNVRNLSPNVILRPQVQDYIFPTAAYVAGPSEVAYYAQFKGIYSIFENPMPVIYPRRSITILEKKIQKIIKKYDINFIDVMIDRQDLEKKIISQNYPESLKKTLEDTRTAVLSQLKKLEKEAKSFNRNLQPIIRKLEGKFEKHLSLTETRIVHETEKSDRILKGHIDKLFVHLYPDNHLQERKLNILNLLYKYDYGIIDAIRCISCLEHEAHHRLWDVNFDNVVCKTCFNII